MFLLLPPPPPPFLFISSSVGFFFLPSSLSSSKSSSSESAPLGFSGAAFFFREPRGVSPGARPTCASITESKAGSTPLLEPVPCPASTMMGSGSCVASSASS